MLKNNRGILSPLYLRSLGLGKYVPFHLPVPYNHTRCSLFLALLFPTSTSKTLIHAPLCSKVSSVFKTLKQKSNKCTFLLYSEIPSSKSLWSTHLICGSYSREMIQIPLLLLFECPVHWKLTKHISTIPLIRGVVHVPPISEMRFRVLRSRNNEHPGVVHIPVLLISNHLFRCFVASTFDDRGGTCSTLSKFKKFYSQHACSKVDAGFMYHSY